MASNYLTTSQITNEGLMVLENELVFANQVTRKYDSSFGVDGAKIGYTLNVRKPARYKGTMGPALNVEDMIETSVPITLTNQFHVDTQFLSSDLLLSIDEFSTRVLKPQIAAIANRVDADGALMAAQATYNTVGTPGTPPTAMNPFVQAGAWLDAESTPRDGKRQAVLDQWTQASMVGGVANLFNPQMTIGEQYKKGLLARNSFGFDIYLDQNVYIQQFGAGGGTPQFDSSRTSSAVLSSGWADTGVIATKGWTNSTAVLKVGDVFSIANVNAVNPQNRKPHGNGKPRYFVVVKPTAALSAGTYTAAPDPTPGSTLDLGGTYTSSGTGTLDLYVAPCCISGGQFQNVTAAPVNNAAITLYATNQTSPQNIAFHENAFALVSADLPLFQGLDMQARASHKDIGMSLRVTRQYTINNDAAPTRIDVLYGWAPLYREMSCRVAG